MKKIYIILILALLAISNYSCNKNETFIFSGIITDSSTGLPISNASVTIAATMIDGSTYSNTFNDITTVSTDANGAYSVEIEESKYIDFKYTVKKDGYFNTIEEFANDGFVVGEEYTLSYTIYPIAYIRLYIQNLVPAMTSDMMYWYFSYGYKEGYSCCDNTQRSIAGQADSSYVCKVNGGETVAINWNYNTSAGADLKVDTLYSVTGDTIDYYMIY